jgi:hypothetical protein
LLYFNQQNLRFFGDLGLVEKGLWWEERTRKLLDNLAPVRLKKDYGGKKGKRLFQRY